MRFRVALAAALGPCVMAVFVSVAGIHAEQPASQWDGVYTKAQATRGESLYTQYCSACHAADLTGDEYAPKLRDSEFLDSWKDKTVGALFELIQTTMPENGPGSLKREQTADILAYIFSINQFPTGEKELPTKGDELAAITFLAAK